MGSFFKSRRLYRTIALYLGSSWVIIEATNYFTNRFSYPDYFVDILMIILSFGIISFIFNEFNANKSKENEKNSFSIGVHGVILLVAVATAYFYSQNVVKNEIKHSRIDNKAISIAVFPFDNLGPDSTYHWMGEGICQQLINHLGNVKSIDVKSKSASFYFKGKDYNPVQIAGLLGINKMIDGSIMVLDSTYRITVNLSNPATGSLLWNETFEGKLNNVFDLQSQIALSITEKINAEVSTEEEEKIKNRLTNNSEAYELFMKGKYHFNLITPIDNMRANSYFKKAIELDEDFVMAHAYLGLTYDMFGGMWMGLMPDSAYQIIDNIANNINEIDKDNPMGMFLKSNVVFFYNRDYNKGIEIAREAYQKIDDKEDIIWFYVMMLTINRHANESITILEEYIAKNPTSALAYQGLCHARLIKKGRVTDTPMKYFYDPCLKCMELDPSIIYGKYYLAELHFMRQEYEESRKLWQELADSYPTSMWHKGIMRASYYLGDTTEATKYRDMVLMAADQGMASPIVMARMYSTLDEIDSVAKYLEIALQISDIEVAALWIEPAFDNVRDEQKFQEIASRLQNAGPVMGGKTIVEK